MSKSADRVISQKFWSAMGLSVTLHVAALGGLTLGWRTMTAPEVVGSSAPIDILPGEIGDVPRIEASQVSVEVEPLVGQPSAPEPIRAESLGPELPSPRRPKPKIPDEALASKEPPQHDGTAAAASSTPAIEASSKSDAGTLDAHEPTVDRAGLHQAMAAAATAAASPAGAAFTQPVVRVDPAEKNLDRAFARAFAWAFALDRSFFAAAPLGRADFVVELGEDGRIAGVRWSRPRAPERLKQLVQRMAKLLSVNRFSLPSTETGALRRRAFSMTVTERHVAVPPEATRADGQAGDIWMLAAGETPTVGHASHPSVADMTGHRIDCELEIVVPTPELTE